MRHASSDALDRLEPLLAELRGLPAFAERKRGVFYARSVATLHFHEEPVGLFADLKQGGEWVRYPVNSGQEQAHLLVAATMSS